jgi:hypothetical protein
MPIKITDRVHQIVRRGLGVHVVGEMAASETRSVKDFIASQQLQEVFRRVNAMPTVPLEFVWLDELTS